MTTRGTLLTAAELEALSEGVSDGSIPVDTGFNTTASVRKHDLAAEDSSLGVNLASIDMINERFIRLFRLGMLEVLRTSPRMNPTRARIVKFGTYMADLQPPLSVNIIRTRALRGYSMAVIEPSMIFSSLDSFFGGFGKGVSQLPAGRLFTPTETRIIKLILDVFFRSLREAWSPLMAMDFEVVSSEINPQFAQIADESDLVVLTRFETEGSESHKGYIDLVYPYASLKPVRDLLRSRVQSGDGNEESDLHWRADLDDALGDASVRLRAYLGKVEITVGQLESMQPGDILYFRKPEYATLTVNQVPAYLAEIGTMGPNVALQIKQPWSASLTEHPVHEHAPKERLP